MKKNDSQITIRAPSDVIDKIKELGDKSGRKTSGELRQALIEYVERHYGDAELERKIEKVRKDAFEMIKNEPDFLLEIYYELTGKDLLKNKK